MKSAPIARAIAIGKVGSEDSGSIPDATRRLSPLHLRHRAASSELRRFSSAISSTTKLRLSTQRE